MPVDKNLFLYDLAVVAIMKNEAPYIKEWLDYHLLAGVNHFFIYDNESEDNLKEVLQPYIDAGLVTYIFYPGKARQIQAYNAAVRDFKFFCRYMAFIDADEFIFPKTKPAIIEIVDDVLTQNFNAALAVNVLRFGSNGQDKADYNYGVLERFTRRIPVDYAPIIGKSGLHGGAASVKTIANPRKINYFFNAHFAMYFEQNFAVNEKGDKVPLFSAYPPSVEKIVINHYSVKSQEEYAKKVYRGTADSLYNVYKLESFSHDPTENKIFDDTILKYLDERLKMFFPEDGNLVEIFAERNKINFDKILSALTSNLLTAFRKDYVKKFFDNPQNRFEYFEVLVKFLENAPQNVFDYKLGTFLTCLSVSSYLKKTYLDDELGALFEEFSFYAIYKSIKSGLSVDDVQLLIKELPRILSYPYPIVEKIRENCLEIIPQLMHLYRYHDQTAWVQFLHLDYICNMLETFDKYTHK